MRKLLLTALALSALAITAVAESHYKPHIYVGVHGGVDGAQVAFTPSVKQKWATGPTGGISIKYAEEKLVGVLAEINIETRGWSEDFEEAPLEYTHTLTYISLPIMTHINFGSRRARCFFNLGPEFSYMIGDKITSNFDYAHPASNPDWPSKKRMTEQMTMEINNKFDYGICGGVGFEFWIKPRHSVYIEGRYYFGLGNIFPATKADTFSASRNSSIAVTLGYNFRLL